MQPVSWHQARRIAADMDPAPPHRVGLESATGSVLAQPVAALTDLPPAAGAAWSGWAVSGIGPWTVVAGPPVPDGGALAIAAGQPVPEGTTGVLSAEESVVEESSSVRTIRVGSRGVPDSRPGYLAPGAGIAPPGSGARAGEVLLKPGSVVTAGAIALAAAAGVDELHIIPPPIVAPVFLESELLSTGPPRRGRDRDVVAALLPAWVMGSAARCLPPTAAPASAADLARTLEALGAEITVVSGTARPGVDGSVPAALDQLGAEILIDRLATHPAGAVVLAELRDGRRILALPREPAAAAVCLALLLTPMMFALAGRTPARWATVMLRDGIPSPAEREQAVAVTIEPGELADLAYVHPWSGPHGLGALASADGIAFLDAGRGARGDSVPVVPLPGGG